MQISKIKNLWQLIREAGSSFSKHKVLKLSASLCFYSMFSIGPIFLVIIYVSGIFWGQKASEGAIHEQISGIIGEKPAMQIQELINNATINSSNFMAILSIIVLIFAATAVFNEMHDSINTIWNLKVKKGQGFLQMLKSRAISFILIGGFGLVFLLILFAGSFLERFMQVIRKSYPDFSISLFYVLDIFFSLLAVGSLFAIIYKVLPDAHISWKDVIAGATFAAILFMAGKFGFSFFIKNSNLDSSFGSAGSFVILLVWFFYSANMLYFGAEFTKAYTMRFGDEITPKKYAIRVKVIQSND